MRAAVRQYIGPDFLQVEANSYLELLRIVCTLIYIMGKKRGYVRMLRLATRSAWSGDIKITDAGCADHWRFIAIILFIESIQARPQGWVADLDSVPVLRPTEAMVSLVMRLVQERKEGKPPDMRLVGDYHALYDAQLRCADLTPGHVRTASGKVIGKDQTYTLICTCSRSEARAGRCHRVWAAWWLDGAGWEIYCDWVDGQQKLLGV